MYRFLILISLVAFYLSPVFAQNQNKLEIARWGNANSRVYIYNTALSQILIGESSVTIKGNNLFQKTTSTDVNGSKYNPLRSTIIVGIDSLPGLNATFYDLEENTTYTTYQSLMQWNIDGSTTYKKTADTTFTTPVGFNADGTYSLDGYRFYFSDGSRIILTQEE